MIDSNTEYDWKIQHSGKVKKLEDRLSREVHIPVVEQPAVPMDNNSATTQAVAYAIGERDSSGPNNDAEFPSMMRQIGHST